jgi:hypothetical protein
MTATQSVVGTFDQGKDHASDLPKEEHIMISKLGLAAALAGALMLVQPGGATAASLSQAGMAAKPGTANTVTQVHYRKRWHKHRGYRRHWRNGRYYNNRYYRRRSYSPYYYGYRRHRYYQPGIGIYLSF